MVDVCLGKQLNGPDLLSVQGNLWSGSQLVETEKEILQAVGSQPLAVMEALWDGGTQNGMCKG